MYRFVLMVLASLVSLGLCNRATAAPKPSPAAPHERPNIVVMIGDDHGYPYFGFMGSSIVLTPNLDALARSGTVFPYGHTTDSVCPTSLNSILTGLFPVQWQAKMQYLRRHGNPARRREAIAFVETLPRLLATAGYVSFQAGKYWEGPARLAGFTAGTVNDVETSNHGGDTTLGRETLAPVFDFIDRNTDRPFFLWFAPMLPHTPFNPPDRYRAPYRGKGLSKSAELYYANCSWFDDVAGRLLAHLDAKGLRDRTLVVYVSDNGWDQPPKGRSGSKGKATMYEMGFRTPIVFSWPGHVRAGVTDDRFVSTVDLLPTLADFAGVSVPPGRTGLDLRPLLEGTGAGPTREELVGKVQLRKLRGAPSRRKEYGYYVRDRDWHYIRQGAAGVESLYDERRDPDEEKNVAAAHPDVVQKMRERLRAWEQTVTAPFAVAPKVQPTRSGAGRAARPEP